MNDPDMPLYNFHVSNDSSYPVVGFFCISAVDGHGNVLDDVEIEKIERYGREWLLETLWGLIGWDMVT